MHDVISAFLDNEPFDPQELAAALAEPEGRDLLLDLIALRTLVEPAELTAQSVPAAVRRPRWLWLSAAAVLLASAGGYQLGNRAIVLPTANTSAASIVAPEPTAVLKFEPGINWTESPRTGGN